MLTIEFKRPVVTVTAAAFGIFVLWYLIISSGSKSDTMGSIDQDRAIFNFHTVEGFFSQDDPKTDAKTFDYEAHNFGLIDRNYDSQPTPDATSTQWKRFENHVKHLASSSTEDIKYKVIYVGRHGEGYHNVGEAKYGTKAWDDYWSKLDGDGELYWVDAHLTDIGKEQALHNNAFIKRQVAEAKMPAPEHYYTSPLYRCLQTANLTYSGLDVPAERPFKPAIKEMLREVMGEHTCDKRSTRTVIHEAFPDFPIEAGFSEEDELWQADHRETFAEHDVRTQRLLDDVFEHDSHIFLSFTSHSGAIASLLRVIGHHEYRLPTGAMMPVFVKATRSRAR